MASGNFPRFLADFGIRKSFTDSFFYTVLFFRAEQTPVDPALDGIQKFQPVLERRFRNRLPLIVAPFTAEESPIAPDVLDINLEMHSRIGDASPTDLSFWHDPLAKANRHWRQPSPRFLLRGPKTRDAHS